MQDPRWYIISAEHQVISPGSHYRWHNAPRDDGSLIIKLLRRGSLPFRRGARPELVRAGSVLHFAHGEDSDYGFDQPVPESVELSYLSFRGAGLEHYWRWFDSRCQQHWASPASNAVITLINDLIQRFVAQPHARDHGPRIHQLVMAYSEGQEQQRRQQSSPLHLALEQLHDDPLSISSLNHTAQHYGISREHLSRSFQQRYGTAAQAWLAQARLGHARQLLGDSDLSVERIAHICGYSSSNVLARALRSHYGHGPRALRRQLRQQLNPGAGPASGRGSFPGRRGSGG